MLPILQFSQPCLHCWSHVRTPSPPPLWPSPSPFLPWDYQWRGQLDFRVCCCDLDFKAEPAPGADSQRDCSWPSLAEPLLGPSVWLHLGVQVSVPASARFLWGLCWPCCLAHCVFVSHSLPPREACLDTSRGLGMEASSFMALCLSFPADSPKIRKVGGVYQPRFICRIPSPLLVGFVGSLSQVQGHFAPSPSLV